MWLALVLLTGSALNASPPLRDGTITGVVVRVADHAPVPRAEVVLRAKVDGQLLPSPKPPLTIKGDSHSHGFRPTARTSICRAPIAAAFIIRPECAVDFAAAAGGSDVGRPRCYHVSNPLVVRQHTIALYPELGVLRVTESMLIDNPSAACYVGQAAGDDTEPVTLQLAIPADFAQVTFASEFFGRRFSLLNGKLVTSVPWPPGQRELTFSYVLASTKQHYVWQRALDCRAHRCEFVVHGDPSAHATCNLERAAQTTNGEITLNRANERSLPAICCASNWPMRLSLS